MVTCKHKIWQRLQISLQSLHQCWLSFHWGQRKLQLRWKLQCFLAVSQRWPKLQRTLLTGVPKKLCKTQWLLFPSLFLFKFLHGNGIAAFPATMTHYTTTSTPLKGFLHRYFLAIGKNVLALILFSASWIEAMVLLLQHLFFGSICLNLFLFSSRSFSNWLDHLSLNNEGQNQRQIFKRKFESHPSILWDALH